MTRPAICHRPQHHSARKAALRGPPQQSRRGGRQRIRQAITTGWLLTTLGCSNLAPTTTDQAGANQQPGQAGQTANANTGATNPAAATALVDWASPEGILRLERSHHKIDFFRLANRFESQQNKAFCGPTSATIVLNALRLRDQHRPIPHDPRLQQPGDDAHLPPGMALLFSRYTQNTVLEPSAPTSQVTSKAASNAASKATKSRARVLGAPTAPKAKDGGDYGLQLRQLNTLLQRHGLQTTMRIVDPEQLSQARMTAELKQNLATPNDYVLINYKRSTIGQAGGGHISPLGAYDAKSDSFLILDVNPNKADWVWVSAQALHRSMATRDTIENRGYILVRDTPLLHSNDKKL